MSMTTTSQPREMTIKQRLQSPQMIEELGKAMPKHCKPERMARIAITALTRTPKLAECTQASFFECLLSLSQWGLEPDGRRAHLIPYGNKATLIIDYKGYVELAYRSGVVRNIHADVVRQGDIFVYSTGRVIEHVPHFLRQDENKPEKPGNIYAVYCQVELVGDTVKTEVLSRDDVEAIRKRSRAGNSGPWVTDWNEMAKKTAFRRASKWIPLSAEIRDAFERDDDTIEGTATPTRPTAVATVSDLGAILHAGNDEAPTFDAEPIEHADAHTEQTTRQHDIDPITLAAAKLADCQTLEQVDAVNAEVLKLDLTDEQGMELAQMVEQRQAAIEAAASKSPKGKSSQKSLV